MKIRNEYTLFQSRQSVAVIPDLIREPDGNTLIQTTWRNTTGSRIKSGMTRCASSHLEEGVSMYCGHKNLYRIHVHFGF